MLSKADISRYRDIARSNSLRHEEALVFVEGFRAISGAINAGAQVRELLLVEGSHSEILNSVHCPDPTYVDQKTIDRIATTTSPQAAIAICDFPRADSSKVLGVDSPIFILDHVADPGNVGTIIRSCVAFGIKGLITLGGCDPYHPKVVRSSAGTIFALEVYPVEEFELPELLTDRKLYCADMAGTMSLEQLPSDNSAAIVFGNEAHGIITSYFANNAGTFSINMAELCESLNVAMTATIVAHQLMMNESK